MSRLIKLQVRRRASAYRFTLLICAFSVALCMPSYAQYIKHVVEKEISLTESSKIVINAPKSVRITGEGMINTRQIGDQYIVSRKAYEPNIYVIEKKMIIKTWNQNSIKQLSTVTFQCATTEQEEKLKKALAIKLVETMSGRVEVNCELNIDKFQVENGWFKKENNHVILDDGITYPIEYLSISSTIYIPMDSEVSINSKENDITIDRHHGKIILAASGGSIRASEIHNLRGEIKFGEINVDHIGESSLSLQNSRMKSISIQQLSLESATSQVEIDAVENLNIIHSVNDQFTLGKVYSIKVNNSLFSSYNLNSCRKDLDMILKNCDVDIKSFGAALKYAYIKNQNAKMHMGVDSLKSFKLVLDSYEKSAFNLPNNLDLETAEHNKKSFTLGKQPAETKLNIDCALCDVIVNNSN